MTAGRRFELAVLTLDAAAIPLVSGSAIEHVDGEISRWVITAVAAGQLQPSWYGAHVDLVTTDGGRLRGRAIIDVLEYSHGESRLDVRFVDPPAVRYRRLRAVG